MFDFKEKNGSLSQTLNNSVRMPSVAILLCTYNGDHFLIEQLISLEKQVYQNWVVIASDDGSSDLTLEILNQYRAKWPVGKLTIRRGPRKGFCQNFLSLACDSKIEADFYAFCDQDDVWLPNKLQIAIENIVANQSAETPYVYCGRTQYVSSQLKPCGLSPAFVFPRTFRNALVQSIAGGNTMVFNKSTKSLIEKIGPLDVPSHDWWVYLLVTGVGGEVFYDSVPQILYRQHEYALVGGNNSLSARLDRIQMLIQGRFKNWNTQNIRALKLAQHLLVKNNQEILNMFESLRDAKIKDRLRLIGVCGLYRQTKFGTYSLVLAALIGKL